MARKIKFFLYHDVYEELEKEDEVDEELHNSSSIKIRVSLILLFGLCILGVFGLFWFSGDASMLKDRIDIRIDAAVRHVELAQQSISDSKPDLASVEFSKANQELEAASAEINKSGKLMKLLINIYPKSREAKQLIEISKDLTSTGKHASEFISRYQDIKYDLAGNGSENNKAKEFLSSSEAELVSIKAEIRKSLGRLGNLSLRGFSGSEKLQIETLKEKLRRMDNLMVSVSDVLVVMREFFSGKSSVLILFQNNRELRATGGFLGTYGRVVMKDATIKEVKVSSIYDLDGQLVKEVIPPEPIFAVNNRWYLRDSNWFSDFPTASKKITTFYEREGGETPDVVIALTPEVVVRLLHVTGPIDLPAYRTKLDEFNFVEKTQFLTSVAYDKKINEPKAMIADFLPLFLQRLISLEGEKKVEALTAVSEVLSEKHILLFSRDKEAQDVFEKYNWAGKISSDNGDYLMVNISNLGGTKVDTDILQNIMLETQVDKDGNINETLTIHRTNPLPSGESHISLAYLRVYVPLGSKFVSAEGFSEPPFDPMNLIKKGEIDPDVNLLESTLKNDRASKTDIYDETGKTVFANWLKLMGGESKTVQIKYRLPFKYNKLTSHKLLVQKQPGSVNNSLSVKIRVSEPWKIIEKGNNFVRSISDFKKDESFGLVIDKNK